MGKGGIVVCELHSGTICITKRIWPIYITLQQKAFMKQLQLCGKQLRRHLEMKNTINIGVDYSEPEL